MRTRASFFEVVPGRIIFSTTLAICAVLILGACAAQGTPTSEAPAHELVIGMQTDAASMDPKQFINPQSEWVGATWGEGLTWINPSGEVEPLLAESWEIEDETTYTFHLRKNVVFHNGETFNADSVRFSLGRLMAEDSTVQNYGQWIDSLEVIDDYTVKMVTPQPDPLFLKRLAHVASMLPPEYGREVGDDGLAENPVGTGPWKFVEWVRDSHITFEAFEDYWRPDQLKIDSITWRVIPEPEVRSGALQAGEIDIADRLPAHLIESIADAPEIQIQSVVTPRTFYIAFDMLDNPREDSPIMKAKVRQALNHAVDVDSIMEGLMEGQAVRANSLFSHAYVNYAESIPPMEYDPTLAEQLLTEAGYPDGIDLKLDCLKEGWPYDQAACQAVVADLAEVGVNVELEVYESGRYWTLEEAHELPGDMFFEGAGDRYLDGEIVLQYLYRPDLSVWAFREPSDEFKALHDELRTTLDPESRKELGRQLTMLMQEDPAAIWLWNLQAFQAVRSRVHGYTYRPDELMYFYGVSMD